MVGICNLASWEAEAGESLEPRRRRMQWAEIAPLHSNLVTEQDSVSKIKKKESVFFCNRKMGCFTKALTGRVCFHLRSQARLAEPIRSLLGKLASYLVYTVPIQGSWPVVSKNDLFFFWDKGSLCQPAGMQWHNLSSLQLPPPRFKWFSCLSLLSSCDCRCAPSHPANFCIF